MFKLFGNTAVNLDHVRSIRPSGSSRVVITYMDGDEEGFDVYPDFDIHALGGNVIASPPGYSVVQYWGPTENNAKGEIVTDPIIAFAVFEAGPIPITLDGMQPEKPILRPDGRVEIPLVETFDSIEAFRDDRDKREAAG